MISPSLTLPEVESSNLVKDRMSARVLLFVKDIIYEHWWSLKSIDTDIDKKKFVAGDFLLNDDASSQSSLASYKYSNMNYIEKDFDLLSCKRGEQDFNAKHKKSSTRMSQQSLQKPCHSSYGSISSTNQSRMPRVGSLVDVRSQLLHRTLVEEIAKRRLFNTVGAVENIGYHEPKEFSSKDWSPGFSRR